jgi:hypothetical protein
MNQLLIPERLFVGEQDAKQASLARVLSHAGTAWREQAHAVFLDMPVSEVTGEDIRLTCEDAGIRPHHPNAWGAFVSWLVNEGDLMPTGRYVPMKAKGSHARKTQVYRIV